jgi:hypothetical protein
MHSVYSRLFVLAGTAAVAAAGSIAGILLLGGRDNTFGCGRAPVPARAKAILATYAGRISYSVDHENGVVRERRWSDPITGSNRELSFDSSGRLTEEIGTIRHGRSLVTVFVTTATRTWLTFPSKSPSKFIARNLAAEDAEGFRDQVARGTAHVVGRAKVDGHATLRLHQVIHPQLPKPANLPKGAAFPRLPKPPPFRVDTWVDSLTFLPVRTRTSNPGGSFTTDEYWLLRTPANVAKTKLTIPLGFKHVHPNSANGTYFSQLTAVVCQ